MFALALYRAIDPLTWRPPKDDFDPLKIIGVVTDRPDEPKAGSTEYFDAIIKNGSRLAGIEPNGIVELYVTQDLAALNDQASWAKGFDKRVASRVASLNFDAKRRQDLLNRVTPRQAGYRWTFSEPRVPFIDFTVFNPLDHEITGIDFLIDLLTTDNKIVGSSAVSFRFDIPLAPDVESKYSMNVGSFDAFSNKRFMDLRDPLQVAMRVKDVHISNGESIMEAKADDSKDGDRSRMVRRLFDAIGNAKLNLSKYRIAFS